MRILSQPAGVTAFVRLVMHHDADGEFFLPKVVQFPISSNSLTGADMAVNNHITSVSVQ
jgi:hypothetical protein